MRFDGFRHPVHFFLLGDMLRPLGVPGGYVVGLHVQVIVTVLTEESQQPTDGGVYVSLAAVLPASLSANS